MSNNILIEARNLRKYFPAGGAFWKGSKKFVYAVNNLKALGIKYTPVYGEWGRAIDPDSVRNAMKKKRHKFIYMTHNESSTAVVNPITPIGEIAREFDALLISDSISAIGGIEIDMGENGADVVAGLRIVGLFARQKRVYDRLHQRSGFRWNDSIYRIDADHLFA